MRVPKELEQAQKHHVSDVHEKNRGYNKTSLDLPTGELRLIEVKGIGAATDCGSAQVKRKEYGAKDSCDCHRLYVVTDCAAQEPIRYPASFPYQKVTEGTYYQAEVNAMTRPIMEC